MATNEEIRATVKSELFRFHNATGDVVVLSGADHEGKRVSLKGPADETGPKLTSPYRFFGYWGKYRGQPQFCFSSFVADSRPVGREAIIGYLCTCPGIGRTTAVKLYEKWGDEAVTVLKDKPSLACQGVHRFSVEIATAAAEHLQANASLETLTIELMDLFRGRGFPKDLASHVVKKWGNRSAELIRRNPYLLMRFRGIGFKRADQLYLQLGHNPGRLKRQALCVAQAVADESNGSTWVYEGVGKAALRQAVAGADLTFNRAVRLAVRGGLLEAKYTDGADGPPDLMGSVRWLAERSKSRAEQDLAERINTMMGGD